jgi:death-associated protein kinase
MLYFELQVVYIKSHYQDLVCLQLCWLCSNVIGHLLSLDFVAETRVTGCYTVDDFQVAFSECEALYVLQVLEALQICTQASCIYSILHPSFQFNAFCIKD